MTGRDEAKEIEADEIPRGSADADESIETVWPGGMPKYERDIWNRLPPSRRMQAARRLAAIVGRFPEHGAPARFPTAALAAKAAGVATPTFYAIAKRWKSDPTLASLGVYLPSASRDGSDEPPRAALRARVRDLLIDHPDRTSADVLDALGGEAHPSVTTVTRVMQEVRRSLPTGASFGQRLVFDSAGLDLLDDSERHSRLRLCAVLDEGTGLILGWDIAPEHSVLLGYRLAARHAAWGSRPRFAEMFGLKMPGGMHDLRFSNGVPSVSPPDSYVLRLPPAQVYKVNDHNVRGSDFRIEIDRRLGRRVVATLGERVAGIWMGSGFRRGTRSYRTGRESLMPISNLGLHFEIGGQISRLNDERLSMLEGQLPSGHSYRLVASYAEFFKKVVADMPVGMDV